MEESTCLLYGRAEEREIPSRVRDGVTDSINALDKVAISYGVNFSQDVIDQLYQELDKHIEKMKG